MHDAGLSQDTGPDIAENLRAINAAVADCESDLQKLARTCCMAERSARMVKLNAEVTAMADITRFGEAGTGEPPVTAIDQGISQVEKVGGALGELYATCCTASREKLYISMFKSTFDIHTSLWRLKGHDH